MEYFFYDDKFCTDMADLLDILEIDEENISEQSDDLKIKIEHSTLEPIFKIDTDTICQLLAEANEDRLSEDFDEETKVKEAISQSMDFEKLQSLLPKLYYPNGNFETLTKKDLVNYFN